MSSSSQLVNGVSNKGSCSVYVSVVCAYEVDAHKKLVPMQQGDVPVTFADTSALERDFDFKPCTPLREGLRKFAQWYKEFYKV